MLIWMVHECHLPSRWPRILSCQQRTGAEPRGRAEDILSGEGFLDPFGFARRRCQGRLSLEMIMSIPVLLMSNTGFGYSVMNPGTIGVGRYVADS